MTELPVSVEQVPIRLPLAYSLFLHAAALSLLIAFPVIGGSGRLPGGAYAVTLASPGDQLPYGDTVKETRQWPVSEPVLEKQADSGSAKRDAGTAIANDAQEGRVAEGAQVSKATDAGRITERAEIRPAPYQAPSIQSKASPEPEAHPVFADPRPGSTALILPPAVSAKATVVEAEQTLPQKETVPPVPDGTVSTSEPTAKTSTKHDSLSSPDLSAAPPETRGKDTGVQGHTVKKPERAAPAKVGHAEGSDSDTGSQISPGSEASLNKSGTGGAAKHGVPPGAGGNENSGTGNVRGTTQGPAKGYEFSTATHSGKFGLLRGSWDTWGQQTFARRQGHPNQDKPEQTDKKGMHEEPLAAVHIPEALLSGDIKVAVVAEKNALSDIAVGLSVRAHPANRKRHAKNAERKVEEAEITIGKGETGGAATKFLTLKRAEKGVYILTLTNGGNASSVAVTFHFYAGYDQERTKEYTSLPIPPANMLKFIFLMPEALFWDDTGSFSGSIEDSHSITKFRHETGLLWREEKE